VGISPLFAKKARGSKLWDIDGNKYIDLVNSLAAVTLGYRNKIVDKAVKKQIKKGTIFSLPDKIEYRVASLLKNLFPSIEMVRFGKNASDCTSAAIRLARSYTGREYVAVAGYHGWQDWYIASTSRSKGVPQAVIELTKKFSFNNIESLRKIFSKYKNKIAAVILEPIGPTLPDENYLSKLIELCRSEGSISIFDETLTGFRVGKSGAQGLYQVNPDLTVLGKGIANGYPLAALGGRAELMKEMNKIFFSTTFGGETVSLAAAEAVLESILKHDFTVDIKIKGEYLNGNIQGLAKANKVESFFELTGHDSWKFLKWKGTDGFKQEELKTFFLQEMFQQGILVLNSHNISLAFSKKDLDRVIDKYDVFFKKLFKIISEGSIAPFLRSKPIEPIFSIR
jgi:glutamate-1-semialdehyde 2,1-aminomutase